MRTIRIQATPATEQVTVAWLAHLVLDIGTGPDGGAIIFDGNLHTGTVVAQRQPGRWTVSFRPNPDGTRIRAYTDPHVVARVIIDRRHDEDAALAGDAGDIDVTEDLLACTGHEPEPEEDAAVAALIRLYGAETVKAAFERTRWAVMAEQYLGEPESEPEPVVLTNPERELRAYLIGRATNANTADLGAAKLTYGAAAATSPGAWPGARFTGIGVSLGNISRYEHAHGRPLLSVLVVYAGPGYQGDGFATMACDLGYTITPGGERAFADAMLREVIDYWTTHSPAAAATDEA